MGAGKGTREVGKGRERNGTRETGAEEQVRGEGLGRGVGEGGLVAAGGWDELGWVGRWKEWEDTGGDRCCVMDWESVGMGVLELVGMRSDLLVGDWDVAAVGNGGG